MTLPDDSDEGHIADTGTFKRFVEHEAELERREEPKTSAGLWVTVAAIVLIIVIAVVVWLLTR